MRNTILKGAGALCVAVAMSAAPALAADVYRTPDGGLKDGPVPAGWAGFYFGANVGASWSDVKFQDNWTSGMNDVWHSGAIKSTDVLAGGQLGVNFQSGSVVYGVEADLGRINLSGSESFTDWGTHTFSNSSGLYGDITGRLGVAAGPTLFYAKGGAAFLNNTFKSSYYSGADNFSNSQTLWGWTAGGGVEHMFRPGWSFKAEYLHFDFGEKTFNTFAGYHVSYAPTADTVKLGLNYHVGSGYEPLK